MNIIETVKDLLQRFPKISEVCNDVHVDFTEDDRLANSGILLELQMWLEREGTGLSVSAEVGNETFTGTVKKIVCSNGMVYAVPQENMTDGVMYQLQINAQYTIESEEF